ncbi:hypothetical protein [uncultured Microbacterium sp.]|nr:hypothetical protein [uncultured Microbacterium sp.]
MTNHDGRADDAPDHNSKGAGSESPEEGAAAQQDADDAATSGDSPTGEIG